MKADQTEQPLDKKKVLARAQAALKRTTALAEAFGPPAADASMEPAAALKPKVPAPLVELSPEEIKEKRKRRSGHVLKSTPHAAAVILGFNPYHDRKLDVPEMMDQLSATIGQVEAGDLSSMEAMLVSQATALQSIFSTLAVKAAAQSQIPNLERLLGLALKAQAQSRTTIATLADLKFPRQVSFVRQTNNAQGAMQVNNGVPSSSGSEPAAAVAPHLIEAGKVSVRFENLKKPEIAGGGAWESLPGVQFPAPQEIAPVAVARARKKATSAKRTFGATHG